MLHITSKTFYQIIVYFVVVQTCRYTNYRLIMCMIIIYEYIYRYVCLYFAGIWPYCTSHYILSELLLVMYHQQYKGMPSPHVSV